MITKTVQRIASHGKNPRLESNTEWIGCTVCEIFAFKLYCDPVLFPLMGIEMNGNNLFRLREIGMKSRNYFENGNRIENSDCYMKMELGIEIKFIFRMEIMRIL